ncbi:unnamed protein product [Arctogadus glacialis]
MRLNLRGCLGELVAVGGRPLAVRAGSPPGQPSVNQTQMWTCSQMLWFTKRFWNTDGLCTSSLSDHGHSDDHTLTPTDAFPYRALASPHLFSITARLPLVKPLFYGGTAPGYGPPQSPQTGRVGPPRGVGRCRQPGRNRHYDGCSSPPRRGPGGVSQRLPRRRLRELLGSPLRPPSPPRHPNTGPLP